MAKQKQAAKMYGQGTLPDGKQFWAVGSQSDPTRVHVVRTEEVYSVEAGALVTRWHCDCAGYQYRRKCGHIAAVEAHCASRRAAIIAESEAARKRDTAPLYRDNRSFSIWK